MTKTLIFLISLTFALKSYSNVDCIWTSKQKGIYIEYVAPCDQKYRSFTDSLLRQILSEINRVDTLTKIEIYINSQSLFYRESSNPNYIAISYDLLGKMNNEAIFDYYWEKQMQYSTKFDTRLTPVDINFAKDTTNKEYGLKIVFNTDYKLRESNWNDLKKLIKYSINNISEIQKTQTRDTIGHCCNYYFVSLLTIDSAKIKNILHPKIVQTTKEKSFNQLYLIAIILVIAIFATRFIAKKRSS